MCKQLAQEAECQNPPLSQGAESDVKWEPERLLGRGEWGAEENPEIRTIGLFQFLVLMPAQRRIWGFPPKRWVNLACGTASPLPCAEPS